MEHFKFLFLVLFLLTLIQCGGGNSQETIPGVMTLSTGTPVGGTSVKFGIILEDEEVIELETEMKVEVQDFADHVFLTILDFFAEGTFSTEGPVKVVLDPEGDNTGIIFKLDENDQPFGKHHINLNFIIEINDQQLKFGNVQLGSFTETLDLEVEVQPIEYRNGSDNITLLKMPGLKKFTNVVLKRGDIGELDIPIEIPTE